MKKTYFEKKVEKFFDIEKFWPRLVLLYGEFLPLGSHCDTGTLTRDKALKSRKNFFR